MAGRYIPGVLTVGIIFCMCVSGAFAGGDASAPSWKTSFVPASDGANDAAPKGWVVKGKPGTEKAIFSVQTDTGTRDSFLHMEADNGSASLITSADGVDVVKSPILRWRWRATVLPDGADGRVKSRDDQAIGIYVGTGSALGNKSISYRWDTETPKCSEGTCAYGFGAVKVKWFTVRNKEDAIGGAWFVEERNIAEDFKCAWGFYPKEVYVSVSCNSQYTKSKAAADLGWIEFTTCPVE